MNVCIVGYGAIGPVHAKALSYVENATLYAVCDIDKKRADKGAAEYSAKAIYSFDECINDENIESVHICTPHFLHFEMIKKALDAGKRVVCEKPLVMTKEEFDLICAHENSDKICVVIQNRLNPCIQSLKELCSTEKLGKIKAVKGILTWHRDEKYYNSDAWRGKWATEGGGVLINQAIHTLDFFSYLAGEICGIKATFQNFSLENVIEVEDTVCAYLKYSSGINGIFFATNAYSQNSMPYFEIAFENGTARYIDAKLYINGQCVEEDTLPADKKKYWGKSHDILIKNYYEKNEYFTVSGIKNTMNTLFAIYESAKSNGKEIKL